MILLWSLLFAAGLFAAGAGAQAVALLHDRDGQIAQLQDNVGVVSADLSQTKKQLEAQKILLTQAEKWIDAVRQQREGDAITPPVATPAEALSEPNKTVPVSP
jgi:hypothetical protein